jgi:hypothetical protein
MNLSLKDGSVPMGWAVRTLAGVVVANTSQMDVYAVRTSDPADAATIVRSRFNIATERPLDVFCVLGADTLDQLGIAVGEAAGPL